MSKKQKSRTSSKAEREMETYLRLKNMAAFIESLDSKMSNLEDDVSLLLALHVAEPALADEMKASLREAAKQGEEALKELEDDREVIKQMAKEATQELLNESNE